MQQPSDEEPLWRLMRQKQQGAMPSACQAPAPVGGWGHLTAELRTTACVAVPLLLAIAQSQPNWSLLNFQQRCLLSGSVGLYARMVVRACLLHSARCM